MNVSVTTPENNYSDKSYNHFQACHIFVHMVLCPSLQVLGTFFTILSTQHVCLLFLILKRDSYDQSDSSAMTKNSPHFKAPEGYFLFHNIPTPVPVLGQINPLPTLPSHHAYLKFTYVTVTFYIQCGMLQRTYTTTKSFCQQNQDAITNTYATTNAEDYYRPT